MEHSYVLFRRDNNFGKNRLDWFLVSEGLLPEVENVVYEDRLGRDFDHKEVCLKFGKREGVRKEHIYTDTIKNSLAKYLGLLAALDILNEHKLTPCQVVRNTLANLPVSVVGHVLYWLYYYSKFSSQPHSGFACERRR